MADDMDERYVRYREHVETKEEFQAQLTELKLANAQLASLPQKFDKLSDTIQAELRTMRAQPSSVPDQTLLMFHRLLDNKSGFAGMFERFAAWAVMAGIGFAVARFVGAS